jgi:hypothetical protein
MIHRLRPFLALLSAVTLLVIGPAGAAPQPVPHSEATAGSAADAEPGTAALSTGGAAGFVPLAPSRVLDTRSGTGAPGPVGPGATITVAVAGRAGVPATGAAAVVLNVTAVLPSAPTFVTVYPAGGALPEASNLNLGPSQVRPNLVVAKLGGGAVSLFNAAGQVHLVADVMGWFPEGSGYQPLNPARIVDTRFGIGTPRGALGGGPISAQVTGVGGVPASGVSAVVVNLTGVALGPPTYLSAWPAGEAQPTASNVNLPAGDTRANLAVVKVGTGGRINLFSATGPTHAIADVMGWFPAGGGFTPLTPERLLDTRIGVGVIGTSPVGPQATIGFQVAGRAGVPASGVGAVVLNVTTTEPTGDGFVTAYAPSARRPCTSNLNVVPDLTAPNLVIVPVSPVTGRVALYNAAGTTHLIADVAGWFPAGAAPFGGSWCGDASPVLAGIDVDGVTMTADGGRVAFHTTTALAGADTAPDSMDVYVLDDDGTGPIWASRGQAPGAAGDSRHAQLSPDGRYLVFASSKALLGATDTNGEYDVFVQDLQTGALELVSGRSTGAPGAGRSLGQSISDDGRYVVFASTVVDLDGTTRPGPTAVWVRDRQAGTTRYVASGGFVGFPAVSGDGRRVAFQTDAALAAGDANGRADAYLFDLGTAAATQLSVGPGGAQGTPTGAGDAGLLQAPSLSFDGRTVAFVTAHNGLVPGDGDATADGFVWRDGAAQLLRVPRIDGRGVIGIWLASERADMVTQLIGSKGTAFEGLTLEAYDLDTGQAATVLAPRGNVTIGSGRPDRSGEVIAGSEPGISGGVVFWR